MADIVIVTRSYPWATTTEEVFVRAELEGLAARFDRVILMPICATERLLSVDVPGVEADLSVSFDPGIRHMWRRALNLLHPPTLARALRAAAEAPRRGAHQAAYAFNVRAYARALERAISRLGLTPGNTLIYSYWLDFWVTSLADFAQRQGYALASRAHRHEVFYTDGNTPPPFLRRRALASLDKILPVSDGACDRLRQDMTAFGLSTAPLQRMYLGSHAPLPYTNRPGPLRFISVSRLVPVKRPLLLLDTMIALARRMPEREMVWTHVGDGPLMEDLCRRLDKGIPPNLTVDLRGALDNDAVHRLYATTHCDMHLLLSSSEGLPICVCEAMSYGVPPLVTATGAAEALGDDPRLQRLVVGIDTTPDDIAARIAELLPERQALSAAVKARWSEHLDATRCSYALADTLRGLLSAD